MKSGQSGKPHKPSKSREVSSRFFSSDSGIPSPPNRTLSPVRRKIVSASDTRKHRSVEEIGLIGGLWPSTTSFSLSSSKKSGTLADHLGNDRLIDYMVHKNGKQSAEFLSRQKSCSAELNRFEKEKESSKENRPIGGSMRYTGKFRFPGKSSSSSSSLVPERMAVDLNALDHRSSRRKSDNLFEFPSSESERSEVFTGTDFSSQVGIGRNSCYSSTSFSSSHLSSTASSRKPGIEVPARFLHDPSRTHLNSESNSLNPINLTAKNGIKRVSSLKAFASATSQWALSPGRSASSPLSAEFHGKPIQSFSNLRPTSPTKSKGMSSFFSLGLELLKGKRSSSSANLEICEKSHQLRLVHDRLLQWKFANARAEDVNLKKTANVESTFSGAWVGLSKMQSFVTQKRTQFQKQKLELKLNRILYSQVKPLGAWADIERQHLLALSMAKDCIHSVVCRVPLTDGAKVDPQPVAVALRQAIDLTSSIKMMITSLSPTVEKTVPLLWELAEVVTKEKTLLEECFELLGVFLTLELQERSLKCHLIQLNWQQQKQLQQEAI